MPEQTKPTLPVTTEIASDAKTVQSLVDKYDTVRDQLPGVLASALGGLRTAVRGFNGHIKAEADKAAAAAAAKTPAGSAPASAK